MAQQYSTLDTTIRRALGGEGDENKDRYVRAFIHARRWFEGEYVSLDKAYGSKSVRLEVGADRVVQLPDDYVEWNMVGIRHGETVHNLLHNPRLVAVPVDEPATAAHDGTSVPLPDYGYCYHGLGADGVDVWGYGRPTMREGEFTIDRAARLLRVSSVISPGQELVMSYVSDAAPCGEQTLIHPFAEPWLEFYILHFLHKSKNPMLAADYKRDAERARTDYLVKRTPWQMDDLYAAMRNTLAQRK